ncbi:MAG: hypothetical protein ACRDO2_13200 [Nocardioidaceae bacterium]
MASLADGHLTHSLLAQAHTAETEQTHGQPLEVSVADALQARMLQFDAADHAYRFPHALLREAVDAGLLPTDRMRWHRRWAELLSIPENQSGDPRLRMAAAHHWAHAGADSEAFDAAIGAAREATRLGAMAEAAAFLGRALTLWDRVRDAADRAGQSRDDLVDDAVMAMYASSDLDRALALIDFELQRSDLDDVVPARDLQLRLIRSSVAKLLGQRPDEALYAEAVASTDVLLGAQPTAFGFHALLALGWFLRDHADHQPADRVHARALAMADQRNDLLRRRWATTALARHDADDGRLDEALSMCARMLPEVHETSELVSLESHYGVLLRRAGRFTESLTVLSRAESRLADARLAPAAWEFATWQLILALLVAGDWDAAHVQLGHVQEREPTKVTFALREAQAACLLACWRGDLELAQSWADQGSKPDVRRAGCSTLGAPHPEISGRGDRRRSRAPAACSRGVGAAVADAWHRVAPRRCRGRTSPCSSHRSRSHGGGKRLGRLRSRRGMRTSSLARRGPVMAGPVRRRPPSSVPGQSCHGPPSVTTSSSGPPLSQNGVGSAIPIASDGRCCGLPRSPCERSTRPARSSR